jgi:hypothetical protein
LGEGARGSGSRELRMRIKKELRREKSDYERKSERPAK